MMHVVGVYHDGRVARFEANTEDELKLHHDSLVRSGAHVSIVPDDVGGGAEGSEALDAHKEVVESNFQAHRESVQSVLDSFTRSFQAQISQNAQAVADLTSRVEAQAAEIARLKNPSTV